MTLSVVLLGAPGSGKGTQCEKLEKKLWNIKHISAGELLRDEMINPESEDGKFINQTLKAGKIVPVRITVKLLKDKILFYYEKGVKYFLIDGYPRNEDNLHGWTDAGMEEICDVVGCLHLEVPDDELERRLVRRGKTSGRTDDNVDVIKKRILTHHENTYPVAEYYRKRNLLIAINGDQDIGYLENVIFDSVQPLLHNVVEITRR